MIKFLSFLGITFALAVVIEVFDLKTSNILYEKKDCLATMNGWIYQKCLITEAGVVPEMKSKTCWVNLFRDCDVLFDEPLIPNYWILPFLLMSFVMTLIYLPHPGYKLE